MMEMVYDSPQGSDATLPRVMSEGAAETHGNVIKRNCVTDAFAASTHPHCRESFILSPSFLF
jgi:hypothetical protein